MKSAAAGTSTKVAGPVSYPGWGSFVRHLAWHLRGAILAALLCVYATCSAHGLPALASWVRSSPAVQHFLRTNPLMTWLQVTCFTDNPSSAEGKSMEDALVFVFLTMSIHGALYFGLNGFFLFCDMTGFLKQYKLPRTKRMAMPPGLLRKTLTEGLVNQLVTSPVTLFLVYRYVARFPALAGPFAQATPTLGETVFHMAMASLFNEVLFYAAHRAFHEVPGLYVRFHKQHHKYVGSIGFAAEYAHPLEQVLANQGPTVFYVIAFSQHIHMSIFFTWLAWRLWETFEAHSGYSFTGSWLSRVGLTYGERASFHDWHHSDNRGCYGVYWLDYLFGTMDSYAQLLEKAKASPVKGEAAPQIKAAAIPAN